MALGLEILIGSFSILGIALLGLLWKYSALPKIDWKYIVAGAMFLFSGWAVGVFGNNLQILANAAWVNWIVGIVNMIGAILIITGALLNAFDQLGKK